jgi:beta-N-acetylhexosaminidase
MAGPLTGPRSEYLLRLADTVLQPGFVGTAPPAWVCRRLAAGLGGVALFSRNIIDGAQVSALTAALRAENPDVIVAIDEEAGDVTRLESRTGSMRPGNLALGAVDDPALTEAVAAELGQELAASGITLNYAPDADINSNADNPVIGVRSFGSDVDLVARHTGAWVRGLQSTGVAACAKHFPGHGNTSVDSHHATPVIEATRDELFACELAPFRAAIEAGVQAIMSAHLLVPAIDPDAPATLSRPLLLDVLRGDLRFDGLIVTDGIEMGAVSRPYGLTGATVRALAAGADAICVGGEHADEETAVALRDAVSDAVAAGTLPEERLVDAAERVRRLAGWTAARRPAGRHARNGHDRSLGLAAARRAVQISVDGAAAFLPLASSPHVVEFVPASNIAVGPDTPWGLAEPLGGLLPGTTAVRVCADDIPDGDSLGKRALEPATGRPLVLVVRDAHRHAWMARALRTLLAARPDAVVVEMGVPAVRAGRVYLATYGASRANAQAAAEVLVGRA